MTHRGGFHLLLCINLLLILSISSPPSTVLFSRICIKGGKISHAIPTVPTQILPVSSRPKSAASQGRTLLLRICTGERRAPFILIRKLQHCGLDARRHFAKWDSRGYCGDFRQGTDERWDGAWRGWSLRKTIDEQL